MKNNTIGQVFRVLSVANYHKGVPGSHITAHKHIHGPCPLADGLPGYKMQKGRKREPYHF
jgi:hypothetical protein